MAVGIALAHLGELRAYRYEPSRFPFMENLTMRSLTLTGTAILMGMLHRLRGRARPDRGECPSPPGRRDQRFCEPDVHRAFCSCRQ